ncbi:Para-nitrobenzyl esterase [Penicillium subrubescens]|uniref:Carboxylic ester hydrolase n=1 Tax=Penicillium subrubescens TaxID=1316194 RepID=A0A1Q5TXQ4_9EURO|nr:Para-nitrobenzyl esterase [Penicillium subrubescens]
MFWIHGGAFTGGSGSDPTFDGGNLASRGDVVVVTINYRLGTLGFLALNDGITNGNYGMADQITALDWVRRNIQDFGGDPNQITIFGQSAGAGSVRALLASPKAQGKFAGAIMQSNLGGLAYGTTYSKYYTIEQEMQVAGNAILSETNCTDASSQLDCLRAVPATTISSLRATTRYLVVDGEYLTSSELNLKDPGSTARVPLMLGTTRDDGATTIGYPKEGETFQQFLNRSGLPPIVAGSQVFPIPSGSNQTLNIFNTTVRVATDGMFRCIDQATAYAGFANKVFPEVFFYEFNRTYPVPEWSPNPPLCQAPVSSDYPNGDPRREYFKCHSGELYYVFGNVVRQGLPLRDEFDLPFQQFVLDSWASFARSFNPTPDTKYTKARGYVNTTRQVEVTGPWTPFKHDSYQLRFLQWPSAMVDLDETEQWFNSQTPSIPQFLRTIIQRPELAALVKVAVHEGQDFDGSIRYYKHRSLKLAVTGDDLKPLVEYIRTTNVSNCDESIQELRSVSMDASVMLQLSQLSSPKSIYLGETSLANAALSDVSFGPPSVRGAIAFIPFNIYTTSQCCILVLVLANEVQNATSHAVHQKRQRGKKENMR